jgi:hypothetical protein
MKIVLWIVGYIILFAIMIIAWMIIALPIRLLGRNSYRKIGNYILSMPERITIKHYV